MMFEHRSWATRFVVWCVIAAGLGAKADAVTCSVGSTLPGEQRSALFEAAHALGGDVLRGDAAVLKAASIPAVASNFGEIESTVAGLAPSLPGATLTVENLYALDAGDLPASEDDVQFFCGVPGSPLLVTVTLSQLPRGQYSLALLHVTGIRQPQQFALVLQNTAAASTPAHWMLAGFFSRPLTLAGHSSAWFWEQGRALKAKGDPLSAFLYEDTAAFLARPADLYTSNNWLKLSRETAAVEPAGLPGQKPMEVPADGQSFAVTRLSADGTLGSLDLRIDTRVNTVADPVAARKDALILMATLLRQHPELRANFHGLWVYQTTAAGQTFAVEQPMSEIR